MSIFRMRAGKPGAFRRGFAAILPLWPAAAPFALAYVLAAREANLTTLQIQLMSLAVFSAAAQIAWLQLLSAGSAPAIILLTMLAMNVHHLLYGLSLARQLSLSRARRLIASFLLTDAAYAVTAASHTGNKGNAGFLFGAELSMFLAWNLFTALGLWAGPLLERLPGDHLAFVVPLTFLLLLLSVVKTRLDALVAIVSAGLAVGFNLHGLGHVSVLLAAVAGPLLGLAASVLCDGRAEV